MSDNKRDPNSKLEYPFDKTLPTLRSKRTQKGRQFNKQLVGIIKQTKTKMNEFEIKERTNKNGSVGELGDELGDTEAARGGAGDVEGKSERREDELDWEVEEVDELLAVASREELVVNVGELLEALHHAVRSSRHGSPDLMAETNQSQSQSQSRSQSARETGTGREREDYHWIEWPGDRMIMICDGFEGRLFKRVMNRVT